MYQGCVTVTDKLIYPLLSRSVPAPAGASQAVQRTILETPVPNVTDWQSISPQSVGEWSAFIKEMDDAELSFIETHFACESLRIESAEIRGVPVYWITPPVIDAEFKRKLFLVAHGGAYVAGAGKAGLSEAMLIASRLKVPVLAIDYRMPPEHPFPAGLDDIVTVYTQLLEGRPANSMALGGSSAGGGLALACLHRLKGLGLQLPGAVFAGTPWTDLTKTGDSYYCNEGLDRALVSYEGVLAAAAKLYVADGEFKDPLVSPIYGEFEGFPPVLLATGSRDLFLSCTIRAHTKLRMAGVTADLLVFEGQSHGDYALLVDSPESGLFYAEMKSFLLQHLQ